MFHRPLGSLAEPPYADDDGRNNDHGRNNRNNHIRIHDSSLKSATDTLLSTTTRLDRSPTPPYPLSITPAHAISHVSDSPETDNHGFSNHARMTNSAESDI